jgi:hypothetical protein
VSNYKNKTCKTCLFRIYGTDTHYVCGNSNRKKLWLKRINKRHKACSMYKE